MDVLLDPNNTIPATPAIIENISSVSTPCSTLRQHDVVDCRLVRQQLTVT